MQTTAACATAHQRATDIQGKGKRAWWRARKEGYTSSAAENLVAGSIHDYVVHTADGGGERHHKGSDVEDLRGWERVDAVG